MKQALLHPLSTSRWNDLLKWFPFLASGRTRKWALCHDHQTLGPAPIPASERLLQTATAELWFKVSTEPIALEGPCFNRDGDLLFCDVFGDRILRLTAEKELSVVFTRKGLGPGGLAIHKDKRIFIAAVGDLRGAGSIASIRPDGSGYETVVSAEDGYLPNDLVFDAAGGFYFSDFRGSSTDAAGGAYYVSPDFDSVSPVVPHIAMANGIALSPDGTRLWITEYGRNLLHRINLNPDNPARIALLGTSIPYHFTGAAPDSMRTDSEGNVYVAMNSQGRVLVFNPNGIPIGQIILPGREHGDNLKTTSMAIKPDTNEIFIVTSGQSGAGIFHATVFAKANALYAHQA